MGMSVAVVTESGLVEHGPDDLPMLRNAGGVVWVDVPEWSSDVEARLADAFPLHPLALQDCARRNQVPKVHVYDDNVFIVLHAPRSGSGGHVHYIELDQFVGTDYLITVHGPLNEAVPPQDAEVEVDLVRRRIASGRFRPETAHQLSHAVVSALTARLKEHTAELTRDVWRLEQAVTSNRYSDPEKFLDEMFRARHGLLTVKTMCTLSGEVYGRMAQVRVFGDAAEPLLEDLVDQFHRLGVMADGQKEYLQGTIEFYQARTNTKMTIAAERLAVIAAVTLPVTALSSVFGMNVIVNAQTHWDWLLLLLGIMAVMSSALLVWTKRKGWW